MKMKTKISHLVSVSFIQKKQLTLNLPILNSRVQTSSLLYHLISTLRPLVVPLSPVLAVIRVIVAARRAPHWIFSLLRQR